MDYDFQNAPDILRIPTQAYLPIKRCPYCQSVFINKQSCEACGRSMLYHPIGEPFGPKSFYGIKENYIEGLNVFIRLFPQFEDKKSATAQSYIRKLSKRFLDLVTAYNTNDLIAKNQNQLFYIESITLIDELLCYGTSSQVIQTLLEENDNSLIGQDLRDHLQSSRYSIIPDRPWIDNFLKYRLWTIIKVEYALKIVIVTLAVIILLVNYKEIISSQFGK